MSLPKQSAYLGRSATLALHRDHENRTATLIRDDLEHPFLALFQLEDGFIVTSEECEYELLPVDADTMNCSPNESGEGRRSETSEPTNQPL